MDKKEAIKQICTLAKQYDLNLLNRNIIFIFNYNDTYQYLETAFFNRNFLHLIGVKLLDSSNTPTNFYNQCLTNRVPINSFELKKDGTTELKLRVLPSLFNLSGYKMIGEYNKTKNFLITEKLCGGIHGCIGFVKDGASKYNVPNTSLQEDIRNLVRKTYRIVAVLGKSTSERYYNRLIYTDKNTNLRSIQLPHEINENIDWNIIITTNET